MRQYKSCRYLEGGLSLSFADVRACAVVQNGRGRPVLSKMDATANIDVSSLLAKKAEIKKANQAAGYSDCVGCPNLTLSDWPAREYAFDWLGITNYVFCNISCNYCWLSYASYSPMKAPKKRKAQLYRAKLIVDDLLDQDLLSPNAVVDWGGGGEPTLNPDFDDMFWRLHDHGTVQWLHTNAVRIPKSMKERQLDGSRLKILCSLDAGRAATYERIKVRDRFDRVVRNLKHYRRLGATVTLKFLVVSENARADEAEAFIKMAKEIDARTIILDIDHRFPEPSAAITETLFSAKNLARAAGIACRFEAVGSNSVKRALYKKLNKVEETSN